MTFNPLNIIKDRINGLNAILVRIRLGLTRNIPIALNIDIILAIVKVLSHASRNKR